MTKVRFGIALTYECNSSCKWCNRFLDKQPWPDSTMCVEDLHKGWEEVQKCGWEVIKVRVTGGEPLLHPQFLECMKVIRDKWDTHPTRRVPVFTSIPPSIPPPKFSWRYKVSTHVHQPPMISPSDLGLEPIYGGGLECKRQHGCGRLFDAYGFSFCMFAAPIGRLLHIDPYSPTPVLQGMKEICRHCPWSMGVKSAFHLFKKVVDGKMEYPTRTYREALERCETDGPLVMAKFGER